MGGMGGRLTEVIRKWHLPKLYLNQPLKVALYQRRAEDRWVAGGDDRRLEEAEMLVQKRREMLGDAWYGDMGVEVQGALDAVMGQLKGPCWGHRLMCWVSHGGTKRSGLAIRILGRHS